MLEFQRTFVVPSGWDEAGRAVALVYWQSRGFTLTRADSTGLTGNRGSLLGNLTSYDMRRLLAKLAVSAKGDSVSVRLLVDPRFQMITEWNRVTFRLEVLEFQSLMQSGASLRSVWDDLAAPRRYAAVKSTLSAGLAGKVLSGDWDSRLAKLESTKMFEPSTGTAGLRA